MSPEFPEIITEPAPFEIRGHHLEVFVDLLQGGITPEEDAIAFGRVLQDRVQYAREHGATDLNLQSDPFTVVGHAYDVTGGTDLEAAQYREQYGKVLADFLDLLPDSRVKLIVSEPDRICGACVFGRHCSQKANDIPSQDDDRVALKAIETTAAHLGLSAELVQGTEMVSFSDAPPEQVPFLEIPAGALKQIISSGQIRDNLMEAWDEWFFGQVS